jgi:hypothetical protein
MMSGEKVSIEEVKRLSRGHFFSDGAMRFFNSRLGLTAWRYRDGYLFFTSEKGPDEVRRYSVRFQDGLGKVHTKGDFQAHSTARQAVKEIKRLLNN